MKIIFKLAQRKHLDDNCKDKPKSVNAPEAGNVVV